MRLGIRAKQIAGVTTIVGVAVVALSAFFVTRVSRVMLHESHARGQMLASQVFHRARQVVTGSVDPYQALRDDPGLRSMLEASIYGESVTGASVLDSRGIVVASSDAALIGTTLPANAELGTLEAATAMEQLRVIYSRDGRTLDVAQPMMLGDEAFGSIRVGVSTLLMRQELTATLRPALLAAAVALVVGLVVAGSLAQLLLRPIHVIRSGLTRLGQGEFGVTLDLPPGDEFGELGTFFNRVSQQLSADRSQLVDQKANLQSAVEHLEDAVALFNPSGALLYSNPAMDAALPAKADRQRPVVVADLPNGHVFRTMVEETIASRASRGPVQANIDGETDLLLMTQAVPGTDGSLVGVLLVARNVTTMSRVQSMIAYSRKLVALGRLTAGIAHEVKNPLNAMMIHLELLRTKLRNAHAWAGAPRPEPVAVGGLGLSTPAPELSPMARGALEHVEIIEGEVRRLDGVVQGFLKFTRPEDLRLQPVRLASLFEGIVPVVEPEAQRNHVKLSVDCPASLPPVSGDAGMLRQAFLNLMINACQAMPQGGSLRVVCAPASRQRVLVTVEDTGVGIPPDHLSRIFDLYFTTKEHGTGIGLSMVYRIVQLHDGDIEVESTPGRGTTFRVHLQRAHEV
jgi:signal transduction histidine kinase/HAMP domain-containing protein